MFRSRIVSFIVIVGVLVAGVYSLVKMTELRPETMARQDAVQAALAPGRQSDGVNGLSAEAVSPDLAYGEPVSPAAVDVGTLPSRPAEVDRLKEAYESGDLDIGINEGPVSDALFQSLVSESAAQGVHGNVQVYESESDPVLAPDALNSGVNFKAIDYTQSQQGVPPDPDIMVGKDHIVVGVNTSFQVFDKSGNSLVGPILYEDFWGNNCATGSANVIPFDPFSAYDEEEGRYVLGITAYDTNVNGGNNGWACIAVSQTDDATGSWWLYSFDGNPGGGTDYFLDYPHIGVGQDALYLGANMFGTFSFVRNHVFAFDKDAMYAGASASSVKFNVGTANFTLQPAKLKGFATGGWPASNIEPHFFVDAQYGNNQNTLTIWQLSDPWGTPSLTQAGTVTVDSYNLPVSQPQLGGSSIQGNDDRLLDVEYWGGKLWATHAVGCNPGGGTVNCLRWYEIDVSGGSPSLVQQGTFASSGDYRSFPDLGVNACGDMLVGYTKTNSGISSVYVAGREFSDSAGLLKEETLVHAGEDFYTAYDSVPRRWGDYTGMALDPDGTTFWYLGEYSRNQSTARWSTWVSSHSWPGCTVGPTPTPTSIPPTPTDTPVPPTATSTIPGPTDTPSPPTATNTSVPPTATSTIPGPTDTPSPPTATNTPAPPTATNTPTNTPAPQMCMTYSSEDTPLSMPIGVASVSSVINVGSSASIADVNVDLDMKHNWVGDLTITLSNSSNGATIVDRPGVPDTVFGCSGNNIVATLDDEASLPVEDQCAGGVPTINGTFTPNNALNVFDGGSSAGSWTLTVTDADPSRDPGRLLGWSIELCTGDVLPTPTNTAVPPTPTNTVVPPTPTNTAVPPTPTPTNTPDPNASAVVYVSSTSDGSVAGLSFTDEDILAYDTGTGVWSMYFDGSDVGLSGSNRNDIDAFHLLDDGSLLFSTLGDTNIANLGAVESSDIIRFVGLFGANTSGTLELYFDGSDVGLSSSGENLDAVGVAGDGSLIISTDGAPTVVGVSGVLDEDMLLFSPTSLGISTSGSWSLYFDGSDVGLSDFGTEDTAGTQVASSTGDIYLTTKGAFAVPGLSGDGSDIFVCTPLSLGTTTSCVFTMLWDGSAQGFAGQIVDGLHIVD